MNVPTYRSTLTSAELCRRNGWTAGTILEGDEGYGPERIVITAVGEVSVLARRVNARSEDEHQWNLVWRAWVKVEPGR
jgi:hypothetical protein